MDHPTEMLGIQIWGPIRYTVSIDCYLKQGSRTFEII
jgi:hypothetical protein